MRGLRPSLVVLLVAVGLLVSARLTLRAQERKVEDPAGREARRGLLLPTRDEPKPAGPRDDAEPGAGSGAAWPSVQDALQRPFAFSFAEPTSLGDVCEFLRRTLKAPVVLDLAALNRQEVKPEDTVQLQLEGVRLKTGLKLLLDQVNLTYQVIPEDNLLVLTDTKGSTDPIDHILSEVKALHRDVHDLQDAVDDIHWMLGGDEGEDGARMRKPTIIEEVPGDQKPGEATQKLPQGEGERPRTRPGA
jgi:hypothetical protein